MVAAGLPDHICVVVWGTQRDSFCYWYWEVGEIVAKITYLPQRRWVWLTGLRQKGMEGMLTLYWASPIGHFCGSVLRGELSQQGTSVLIGVVCRDVGRNLYSAMRSWKLWPNRI